MSPWILERIPPFGQNLRPIKSAFQITNEIMHKDVKTVAELIILGKYLWNNCIMHALKGIVLFAI